MNRALVAACLALAACGPLPDLSGREITAAIHNDYAASLFTLTIVEAGADGGTLEPVVVFNNERIEGYRSAEETFKLRGSEFTWTLSVVSLGERQNFSPKLDRAGGSIMRIEYDFDMATARFAMNREWR